MLPRKSVPDQDLILCASLNRTIMTTNVHPLYLPPVVCWLNRTWAQGRRVKGEVFKVAEVVSSVLVLVTFLVHAVRLWNSFTWGLLGALWSLTVCVTLIGGCFLTVQSSERRSAHGAFRVTADPTSNVSVSQKLAVGGFFLATYIHTWLYYYVCSNVEVVVSRIECGDRRGPSLFPVLKWTTFAFFWINAVGFLRMVWSN